MKVRVTLDETGGVMIPQPLREEVKLEHDVALEVESSGGEIILRPIRESVPLNKEHGVWVFYNGQSLPASATDTVLQEEREHRDLANLYKGK